MTTKTVFARIEKSTDKAFDATFVMSAADLDRTNDTIDPKAYDANIGKRLIALWQHDHAQPVGYWENMRKKGRQFVGDLKLAGTELARMIKQLLDDDVPLMASIGFQAKDAEHNDEGGYHFKAIDIYECSVVSVGAHPQAIRIAKSYGFDVVQDGDQVSFVKSMATTGAPDKTAKNAPRALGTTVSINSPKATTMKTFAEQIKGFEARKTELADTVKSLLAKAADEGRTLDATEAEAHDTAVAEIEQVEKHLGRLQAAEKLAVSTATPVAGDTQKSAAAARSGVITVKDNLAPGQEFARFAKCLAMARGNIMQAEQIAKAQYPDNHRIHNVMKAAVASGNTTDPTWASPLVEYTNFTGDFISFLRPQTIIGRFGQGGIPALRNIPFNVRIKGQTSGGQGYWVGEGAPKPLTKFDFNDVELRWAKVANIAVLTDELVRTSTPSAELLVRDSLAQALIARLDVDFVNPAKAAVANVSPASITNGVTAVPASGTDVDAFKTDAKALMQGFIAANIPLNDGVWIMQSTQALSLSLMSNALGQPEFPGITMNGGTLLGLPVIVSQHVPAGVIVLAAASEIYLSDDGQVMIDASREATLEMNDAPTGTATRSMFQHNEIAIRAERYINWAKRRAAAVQLITGAAYA